MKLHPVVLATAKVKSGMGKTRHYRAGKLLPTADFVQLAQYDGDEGVYVFYFFLGQEITDTYHQDVTEAKAQVEFDLGVSPDEWEQQ